ncbi:STAS domain-containing protein [Amycolatopsis magusensis]|uniref:Anti-anti-sigma regulatory factor n=1 Tax=Amycolatopsis magusensis TaxID=882444 RepID=A0ABS4PR39_9PSEU|nr:STAS domain-containing protein [Amycolatopsis magusensis]MBP2181783.1 anti-anti-sigma regulatory factor [Amycolatopsis magusensis]
MTTGGDEALSISVAEQAGCRVVAVSGELTITAYPELRDVMLKCAVEQPSAVIVDIEELRVATPSLVSVFAQVSMRLSDWPGVPVLLVAGEEASRRLFEHTPVPRFVPVFPTVDDAVGGSTDRLQRRRAKLTLPRLISTTRQAREFTRHITEYWLPGNEVVADAVVVANELVDNVLVHTQSEPALRLELRADLLSVAVGDLSPDPALIREGKGGNGLVVVAQLAKVWGSSPAMAEGKVVWAVLDTEPPVIGLPVFKPHDGR